MLLFDMKFDRKKARKLRAEAGLSYGDAAAKIGVTQDLLKRYESGSGGFAPKSEIIARMARAYRCGVEDLYG